MTANIFFEHLFPGNFAFNQQMKLSLYRIVANYLQRHSKLCIIRFDLTFPQNFGDSDDLPYISMFSAKLTQKLKREKLDPAYFWCREQHTSGHQHYHFVVIVNGHKMQNPNKIFSYAKKFWQSTLKQFDKACVNNGPHFNLYRSDENFKEQLTKTFQIISYLAKQFSKGPNGDGIRNFGMSRIPQSAVDPSTLNLFGD